MLNAIVRFSIRFRGIAISLACALLVYGIVSLSRVPYDVFPEFAPPQVSIQTEAPGLSPEQVEVLVTQPIENAINGVAGIETCVRGRFKVFPQSRLSSFPAPMSIGTGRPWQSACQRLPASFLPECRRHS